MALTDFELDRLELARLNSREHRQESPNKRVLQLAFEEIELLRAETRRRINEIQDLALAELKRKKTIRRSVLRKLLVQSMDLHEFAKRLCRVDSGNGMKE